MRPIVTNQRAPRTAGAEVEALKRLEQEALDSLERLALADRPTGEIAAQADRVTALHRELADARDDARTDVEQSDLTDRLG